MKKFLSFSLLAIMLSTCVSQPASAEPNIAHQFCFGLASGVLPFIGQSIAALSFTRPDSNSNIAENISFIGGHALGMSLWAVPLYFVYRQYTSNK
jgi:hypothetical protein